MKTAFLMLGSASALRQHASEMSLSQEAVSVGSHSALKKVVEQLTDMQQKVQEEGAEEDKIYEKNSCWCKSNGSEKNAAIEEAKAKLESLSAELEGADGKIKENDAIIKDTTVSLGTENENLKTARTQRKQDNTQWFEENKEASDNLDAINRAVGVLQGLADNAEAEQKADIAEQRAGMPPAQVLLSSSVSSQIVKLSRTHFDSVQSDQIAAFVQSLAAPGGYAAPISGQVLGMLKQMGEEMAADKAEAEKAEHEAAALFTELEATKVATIAGLETQMTEAKKAKQEATNVQSNGLEEKEATEKQLAADTEFVATLEETCGSLDEVYTANQKARGDELEALGDVITMLTSDEARGTFAKGENSFLQQTVSSKALDKQVRSEARKVLTNAFRKSGDMALLSIASSVGLDAFSKVKEAVNKLAAAIKEQMQDEVQQKEVCITTINDLEKAKLTSQSEISSLSALLEDKTQTSNELTADLEETNAEIEETKKSFQQAGENYVSESKEYQQFVKDTKAMIDILNMAKLRLEKFYSPAPEKALAQVSQEPSANASAPPGQIEKYEKNKSSLGVMGFIKNIIDDMHTDIQAREEEAQTAINEYARIADESQRAIAASTTKKNNFIQSLADVHLEISDAKQRQKEELEKREELGVSLEQQQTTCNFLLNNFDARQEAMATEISAMNEVVAILSGAQ